MICWCWCEDDEVLYREASPVSYLEAENEFATNLILHGSKDHVVPFEQSVELYQK